MADFSQYAVNLDTPQPGGRQGESPRAAFTKYNDLLGALRQETDHVGPNAPAAPFKAYQRWINTSTVPPSLQIRNAANNDWINAGAAADFQYSRGNIVGTVSESGGVPTGALVQYGSNENGEFWRYAGGMQVWTYTSSISGTGWAESGGKFYSAAFSAPFAAPFAATPKVTVQPKDGQVGVRGAWCPLLQATSSQISAVYFAALQTHTSEVLFDAIGIGRWHA